MIKRILSKFLHLLPGERFKAAIRRFYFLFLEPSGPPYPLRLQKGYFEYRIKRGTTVKSHQDIQELLEVPVRGYFSKRRLKKGDTVIDCGAHFGAFALYAAVVVGPKGKVVAFEPDDLNFEKLKANITLNRLTNVVLVQKGVYSRGASLPFSGSHDEAAHFLAHGQSKAENCLPVVALDSELPALGVTHVDFIKMDVEGAEIEALKGAARTLAGNGVHLAIASYHKVDGQPTSSALEKILSGWGYVAVTTFPAHLTTYAWKG